MGFGFSSIEHAIAHAAQKVVTEANAIAGLAAKLQKYQPAVEAVAAEVDPQAVVIERAAFTALGLLAKASSDVASLQTPQGTSGVLNVKLDAGMIADFKNLYGYLTNHLLHSGITPPASTAQPTGM